ncbi:serine/threonine-protein kinase [Actinoallomurus sp. NPDC052308]|uniref:serine/threonine-protein kinase n=1 Tax=Actinoallomurus sp. NPDC052308 TaxID=3155530 RepID=UPI00343C2FAE
MLPERVGPYEVLRLLGRGGMGSVYLALDDDGRTVAVKVIHPHIADEANGLRRLEREASAMMRLESPHVAEFVGMDLRSPTPYIVTRHVQGKSLYAIVTERGPLSGDALRAVYTGLAEALATIHEADVVHRDLTPRNVMMADGVPVVIDLGIAQTLDATRLTQGAIGTPGYMAPEMFEGHRAGPAADVFAWGATVVFAATGRSCFGRRTTAETMHNVLTREPELDGVPAEVRPTVTAALSKDPRRRPSASAIVQHTRSGPVAARPGPAPESEGDQRYDARREEFRQALANGDFVRAMTAAWELHRIAAEQGDSAKVAWALRCVGEAAAAQQDHHTAARHYEEGRRLAVATGRRDIEAACIYGLGTCATAAGDPRRAEYCFEQAAGIAQETGDGVIEALAAYELGFAAEGRSDYVRAEWLYQRVRWLARNEGNRADEVLALIGLGTCAASRSAHAHAESLLEEALRIAESIGDQELQEWAVECLLQLTKGKGSPRRRR